MELDYVTNLPLILRYDEYIGERLQSHDSLLVCFLDCTGLTEWNDHYGWSEGDRLLLAFANQFTNMLDPSSEIVRLRGDMFIVSGLTTSKDEPVKKAEAIHTLANQLMLKESDGDVGFRLIWQIFTFSKFDEIKEDCKILNQALKNHQGQTVITVTPKQKAEVQQQQKEIIEAGKQLGWKIEHAKCYAVALARWIAAGRPTRSDKEVAEIVAICEACNKYKADEGRCGVCGCKIHSPGIAILSKARLATERCPRDKW